MDLDVIAPISGQTNSPGSPIPNAPRTVSPTPIRGTPAAVPAHPPQTAPTTMIPLSQVQGLIETAIAAVNSRHQAQVDDLRAELKEAKTDSDPFYSDLKRFKSLEKSATDLKAVARTIQKRTFARNSLNQLAQTGWLNLIQSLDEDDGPDPRRMMSAINLLLSVQLVHWNEDQPSLVPEIVVPNQDSFFRKGRIRSAPPKRNQKKPSPSEN